VNGTSGQKFAWTISPEAPKIRLDRYLAEKIPDLSRSRVQQLIEGGHVRINGEPTKASHLIRPGEKLTVVIPQPETTDVVAEEIPLEILYEDEHLLVLNKPPGMVVHPAFGHNRGTLVNALLFHCRNLSGIGGELRPGIVHRLDKDTSGLMVVAKDDVTHRGLSSQFSNRTIDRTYVAVVWGHFQQKEGRLETFYGRSPTNRKKMAVLPEGKVAVTAYKVLEELPLISVVELKLGTGRTHQIRVHMAYLGHPVVSDYVYGGRRKKVGALKAGERAVAGQYLEILKRQALHAKTLGFTHPVTGKRLFFEAPLPDDIAALLKLARSLK